MGYREDAAARLASKAAKGTTGKKAERPQPVADEVVAIDAAAIQKYLDNFDFDDSVTMSQNLSLLALQNHLMQIVSMQSQGIVPYDAIRLLAALTTSAEKLNGLKMHVDTQAAMKSLESQGYIILRSPTQRQINPVENPEPKTDRPD